MSELDEARKRVEDLVKEQDLIDDMDKAAEAHEASGDGVDSETYAAHNRAQEALADHRAQAYPGGAGVTFGSDMFVSEPTPSADEVPGQIFQAPEDGAK